MTNENHSLSCGCDDCVMKVFNCNVREWNKPKIEHLKLTRWQWMVSYPEGLEMGNFVDIGAFTYIQAQKGVRIGRLVEIGSHCSIYSVSTIDKKQGRVNIKAYAKIGSHSTIMPNVTIGVGAIIGAHSFVNKDVPNNCLAYGVPIKIIKQKEDMKENVKPKN